MNTGRSILVIGGLVLGLAACAQPPADQASTPQRSQAGALITQPSSGGGGGGGY